MVGTGIRTGRWKCFSFPRIRVRTGSIVFLVILLSQVEVTSGAEPAKKKLECDHWVRVKSDPFSGCTPDCLAKGVLASLCKAFQDKAIGDFLRLYECPEDCPPAFTNPECKGLRCVTDSCDNPKKPSKEQDDLVQTAAEMWLGCQAAKKEEEEEEEEKTKFEAACTISRGGNRGILELRAYNGLNVELSGVTALRPTVATTGSAIINFVTSPAMRRVLIPNNSVSFDWHVAFSGEGRICMSAEATAETPRGETVRSGPTDCGCITLTLDPTRTPRVRPTAEATRTPRPTRTRVATITPRATRTLRTPAATRTPVPARPTRTLPLLRPTPTATRTPQPQRIDASAFRATCRAVRSGDGVAVLLMVDNGTGGVVRMVRPHGPNATGSAFLTVGSGPSPLGYRALANGARATFKWVGQVDGFGNSSISASATAVAANRVALDTGEVNCGTVGVEPAPPQAFDPGGLMARCTALAVDGKVLVTFRLEITNATGGPLTNIAPFLASIATTGTVDLLVTSGPQPDFLRELRDGGRARFKWQGQAPSDARGVAFIHVGATGTGPNGQAVTTGSIECSTLVIPPRP
jgi:hypothetical protein